MDSHWHAYVAGFFDGEGSISIARNRSETYSDYHKIVVTLSQRAKHRVVLDRVAEEFGGRVAVRRERTRVAQLWAEQAVWQLQSKPQVEAFLSAIQPYAIVKARQLAVGLEFVRTFTKATPVRDTLGRIRDRMLSTAEIGNRERLRLSMRELNELGPPRVSSSQLSPLDLRHRQAKERFDVDPTTIERGTKRYNAKLTDEAVRAIRVAHARGQKMSELARQHDVSFMVISGIVKRTRWRHVPD